jgi:hypothetical protein
VRQLAELPFREFADADGRSSLLEGSSAYERPDAGRQKVRAL